jgi:hypothetical protein
LTLFRAGRFEELGDSKVGFTGSVEATASLTLQSSSIQVLDPNNGNQPVNFTMVSDIGCAAGQVTQAGQSYNGFSVTNCADGRIGSTFSLLDGTASQDTNVVANFVAPPEIDAASDAVQLNGTDGDLQVVQIDWSPGMLLTLGPLDFLEVVILPLGGHDRWESGVLRNYQGPPPTFFDRAYNPATDFHLGNYGRDEANHKVWAVINHNSLFAAGIPFDLVSVVSRKTHRGAGNFDINLPLTGTPGVECRSGGANGSHTLIFTFKTYLAGGDAVVTSGTGSVSGTPVISSNTITVNLTGVTDAQTITLTLQNMVDVANQVLPDTPISVSFLLGDISGNGKVDQPDSAAVNANKGHRVDATNFRNDVNLSGKVDKTDVSTVKGSKGHPL